MDLFPTVHWEDVQKDQDGVIKTEDRMLGFRVNEHTTKDELDAKISILIRGFEDGLHDYFQAQIFKLAQEVDRHSLGFEPNLVFGPTDLKNKKGLVHIPWVSEDDEHSKWMVFGLHEHKGEATASMIKFPHRDFGSYDPHSHEITISRTQKVGSIVRRPSAFVKVKI